MSTKFKDFTLEDPCGSIELTIVDDEHFILEGLDYYKSCDKWRQGWTLYSLSLNYHKSDYPKIKSCINITINDVPLGYLRDVDAEVLLPFYNKKFSDKYLGDILFSVKILRLNKDINGVAGITIRIEINEISKIDGKQITVQ